MGWNSYRRSQPFQRRKIHDYDGSQGLANDIVLALYQGRDGSIWIGTENGLGRLKNGHIDVYNLGSTPAGIWSLPSLRTVKAHSGSEPVMA